MTDYDSEKIEGVDRNLYARDQPDQLRELADFAESVGAHTKAQMLREFADEMELYAPVVKGLLEVESGDFSRERLEAAIEKWDGVYGNTDGSDEDGAGDYEKPDSAPVNLDRGRRT